MIKRFVFLLIFPLIGGALFAQTEEQVIKAAEEISYEYFYDDLKFLADDELRGRDTGSEGYAEAADYVAEKFKEYGLEPFGDNGTYFQAVPFKKGIIKPSTVQLEISKGDESVIGSYGENVAIMLNLEDAEFSIEKGLVFVGYGNVLPKQEIDDYEGVDVEGKVVVLALGAPKGVKASRNPFGKIRTALNKGASGIILYSPKGLIQNVLFKQMSKFLSRPMLVIDDPEIGGSMFDADALVLSKSNLVADLLKLDGINFKKELKKMKKGTFKSIALSSQLSCSYDSKITSIDCKNVLAVLPGTDDVLKDEYIVVSAHLDHLGVGTPVKKDSIYNGMWDNASGVAATINIAKAFKDAGIESKRSIIFASYTGEEKGLYGSKYFAGKNTLDSSQIVANINIDMLGGLVETKDITPLGYTHSNLSEAVDFATKSLELEINAADKYEKMYLERSDQISLIKKGTPALYINAGEVAINDKENAKKAMDKWMKTTYHSPQDDLNQEYSDEAFHTALKVNFLTTYYVANLMDKITWDPESWIYKKHVLQEKQ